MEITSVIKYEGDNSTFIWKHPKEDFNTKSQLIVHESQEAVFFADGRILDTFGPGRYTLDTKNIPLIGKVFNLAFDGESPFHCEVYFVNKTEQLAIKWGTDSKIEYVEPTYQFPIQIGASGEMSIRVGDAKKLLVKLVGTENSFTHTGLIQKFRAFLMVKFKPYLSNYIRSNKVDIFQIDECLSEISQALHQQLVSDFDEYGLSLIHFFVTTIVKPEDDAEYRKFKELHFRQYADIAEAKLRQSVSVIDQETERQKMLIEAQGLAGKRQIEGYTYAQERSFDIAEGFSKNEGSGNFANLGVGLGMMSGVGGIVGGMVTESINNIPNGTAPNISACPKCGSKLPENAKFCLECGTKIEAQQENTVVCPKCGKQTPKGKFCVECGARLEMKCPNCGNEIVPGAKFCLECGQKVEG
jgi:membrane protease subunit (stomatin/prohibitin family)